MNIGICGEDLEKEPVRIADGIFWVGYADKYRGLHCNPYLIIEGDEAVLIDGGNRDDFSTVMLKTLRAGIEPSQIKRLIYQHYDPDLCGSLPQLEAIINSDELKIISHKENNVFINYYSTKTEKLDFRDLGHHFEFATGRRLEFYATPFCHQPGSFVTYDTKTKTLFSCDLFRSFDVRWTLTLELDEACRECWVQNGCPARQSVCPLSGIIEFHKRIMPSNRALMNSLNIIEKLDINIIAPQHGSIISTKDDIEAVIRHLYAIQNVGIDWLLSEELA
ncbi:MAG: MBL fold metallo-hydrolase [Oscillospiraceae bacterium]